MPPRPADPHRRHLPMRAIVIPSFGGPEVLQTASVPDPRLAPREIMVRVRASGVNRADLLQRRGLYPPPPGESEVPGLEFAGTVEAAGDAVTRWAPGQRVMGIVAGGGYAEKVAVHESVAVEIPDAVGTRDAAAIPEAFMTAFDAVFGQAGLTRGETLLVHAAGSGVGSAAVQLGRRAGAFIAGTSRTPAKLARAAALGLELAMDGRGRWERKLAEATDGRGADVILDLVGGPYLAQNQRAIAERGRHVVVGVPGGSRTEIDLRLLMIRRARIFGTVLRARAVEEKAALARDFAANVLPGFASGSLEPVVDRIFPATMAADAHRCLEANQNFGKVLLDWEAT